MNQNKRYILVITIAISVCLSFYSISQSFLSRMNQNEVSGALPLLIPALILIIPIIIILGTIVKREIRYKKILSNGIKSVGIIREVTQTGNNKGKNPEIKIELDVLNEEGSVFLGEVITNVRKQELEFLKKGEPVPIIYKMNNKNEIYIDRKPDVQKLKGKIDEYKSKK